MICPECACATTVMETREQSDGSIRRRRRCLECGMRFTTMETIWKGKGKRKESEGWNNVSALTVANR